MDTDNDIVELDSDEKSDEEVIRPSLKRTAKKSTAKPQPSVATRRQVAMAIAANTKKIESKDKFMENFDPDSSARERRKLTKTFSAIALYSNGVQKVPGALYDKNGIHIASGLDLCDCLNKMCAGCHFPCRKCKSLKCGPQCRNNRKYIYEQIEFHGCDLVIENPFLK